MSSDTCAMEMKTDCGPWPATCHATKTRPHFSTVLDEFQPSLGVAIEADPAPPLDSSDSQPTKVDIFAEYSYGGKKYAFTDHVGRMCECPVCQGVVKKAQSVRCCKKTFCKICLDEALKRFKRCPLCRTENPVTYENEAIDDGVNDLQVLCLHHGKGCEWNGHLLHEPQHREEKCGYEEVECRNIGCKVAGERRLMWKHMKVSCYYREVNCRNCGKLQTVRNMQSHLATCPEHPVECVNGCRVEGLLRKNINSHRGVCPEAVVDCPFKEMGCSEGQLKRKDMQSHTTNAVSAHLALVMKNLVETKQHCEQAMRQQADAHKTQTKSLNARIDQLQVEADAHREETKAMKDHIEELQVSCKKHTLPSTVKKRAPQVRPVTPSKFCTTPVYQQASWKTPVHQQANCKTPGCHSTPKHLGFCGNCYRTEDLYDELY